MRIAFIIICLAAIALGLVQIRAAENIARHEMLSLQRTYEIDIPRAGWDNQVRMAELTAPRAVQNKAQEMALRLIDKNAKAPLASGDNPDRPRRRP